MQDVRNLSGSIEPTSSRAEKPPVLHRSANERRNEEKLFRLNDGKIQMQGKLSELQ